MCGGQEAGVSLSSLVRLESACGVPRGGSQRDAAALLGNLTLVGTGGFPAGQGVAVSKAVQYSRPGASRPCQVRDAGKRVNRRRLDRVWLYISREGKSLLRWTRARCWGRSKKAEEEKKPRRTSQKPGSEG